MGLWPLLSPDLRPWYPDILPGHPHYPAIQVTAVNSLIALKGMQEVPDMDTGSLKFKGWCAPVVSVVILVSI